MNGPLALPSYTILQRQPIVTRKKDINLLVVQGNEVHDKLKPLIENLKSKSGMSNAKIQYQRLLIQALCVLQTYFRISIPKIKYFPNLQKKNLTFMLCDFLVA